MSVEEVVLEYVKVTSGMMTEVGYDPETRDMELVFSTGKRRVYHNVPQDIRDALVGAKSAGSYYNQFIKGRYESDPVPQFDWYGPPGVEVTEDSAAGVALDVALE